MKAKLEQLSLQPGNASFLSYEVNLSSFGFLWHYHPEFELTYILRGRGKRLVGDSYATFEQGDMALLGPFLPHTWVSDPAFTGPCIAYVIQFRGELIESLMHYPELKDIGKILTIAVRGLHLAGAADASLIDLILKLPGCSGIEAFSLFLRVLHKLSGSEGRPLSSEHFKPFRGNENQQRINKVFNYVQQEFTGGVSLKKAAEMMHLSESAFCKFFKRVSGKTFSDYVNEIRISKACELLLETDKPVEMIAFETGFESQTYFNRVFLKKKAVRPLYYRQISVKSV
jgi:AraC-like DNA-binding protein